VRVFASSTENLSAMLVISIEMVCMSFQYNKNEIKELQGAEWRSFGTFRQRIVDSTEVIPGRRHND
jgi:hypothetical protein